MHRKDLYSCWYVSLRRKTICFFLSKTQARLMINIEFFTIDRDILSVCERSGSYISLFLTPARARAFTRRDDSLVSRAS